MTAPATAAQARINGDAQAMKRQAVSYFLLPANGGYMAGKYKGFGNGFSKNGSLRTRD